MPPLLKRDDQTGFSDRAGQSVSVKQLFDPSHPRR
jgi:hypothetical protein